MTSSLLRSLVCSDGNISRLVGVAFLSSPLVILGEPAGPAGESILYADQPGVAASDGCGRWV